MKIPCSGKLEEFTFQVSFLAKDVDNSNTYSVSPNNDLCCKCLMVQNCARIAIDQISGDFGVSVEEINFPSTTLQ